MTDDFSSLVGVIASTYATDTIFILGKGPSVDRIPSDVYTGSLVIGINDAERIRPTDISIFHAEWVKESLTDTGPRAQLYLTSTDFRPSNGARVLQVPHVPLQQENSDLMIQRLLGDDFVVEDVLFMSALRVAREVAQQRGRPQTVYMVGFDFQSNLGYARFQGKHYEGGDATTREIVIGMQENFLLNALYMLRDTNLEVVHVGERSFSRLSVDDLVAQFLPVQESKAAANWKVAVVAEITTNHFGDRVRLERMVRAAKAAGADYVKVQKRDVETFYSAEQLAAPYRSPFGKTFADYRHKLELSADDFRFLDDLCRRIGLQWFASLLDEASYRFVMEFQPPLVKLPSTISEHTDYLAHVADTCDRGIVLSTGMTDQAYEKWVLETFRHAPKLYLMQANSAYPTPAADCNVGVVRHYDRLAKADPRIVPSYSSHDANWFGSALAIAAGARMVEKHVKFGNTEWAHFDAVALDLTTPEFKDYVTKIREAEVVVGSEEKQVNESEHHKYRRR
jgi:N-acetylneuraminate synthase